VLHLLRPWVAPGALLIEIMSESRCFIYWDHEWHQVLYWLRLWVRASVSFVETTSDTRCFIDWDYEWEQVLHLLRPRVTGVTRGLNKWSTCSHSWSQSIKHLVPLMVSINEAPALTHNLNQKSTWCHSWSLSIEIMSKSRCFIYWDHEWHQVIYWLRLWVRWGASFIETTSDTRFDYW
jgi:hypothetical protein